MSDPNDTTGAGSGADDSLLGGAQGANDPAGGAGAPAGDPPAGDPPAGGDDGQGAGAGGEELTLDAEPGDEPLRDKVVALGKELSLGKEAATKLMALAKETVAAREAALAEEMKTQVSKWVDEVRADAEIGGAKLQGNLAVAAKAIDAFGGKALREVLNATGLGNHPVLVKAFVQIGKAIADDRLAGGAGGSGERDARSMYPNSKMN